MGEITGSRRYAFSWGLLGDVHRGRPNLGKHARLEVYRLMLYCFRDVLERHHGADRTDELMREAGFLAGREFYRHVIGTPKDFSEFVKKVQDACRDMAIGIVRLEEASHDFSRLVLTVDEDLDCSGLPETDQTVCVYDEGFIAGLLESFTGNPYHVREIDCWCTGERTCRFQATTGPAESSE